MIERKKKQAEDPDQGWIVSYGDMMTLLLCFFVLIVSYSVIELEKFREAMGSMRGSIGVLTNESGESTLEALKHSVYESPKLRKEIINLSRIGPAASAARVGERKGVEILFSSRGMRFRISSPVLFDVGRATLKPSVSLILGEIAHIIRDYSCEVRVEGHTDSTPISGGRFSSNWDLSVERALAVVEYFVQQENLDPTKLWVAGYGEYRPIVPNDTPGNRAKNRRVEIFLDWERKYPKVRPQTF